MMRLTHNTSCISLSAMEQQPSGSSATIFPPPTEQRPRRPAPLEDQLLMNMQNVTIFSPNDMDLASLGVPSMGMNPWHPTPMSFGTASTNGFTCSDTSSAPMSPISSPPLRKHTVQGNGFHQQTTQRSYYKNPAHLNHLRNNRTNGAQNGYQQYQNGNRSSGFNTTCNNQPTVVPMTRTYRAADEHKPGMRDLGYWLKKLRLHKYAPLFQDMTYRQLLNLTTSVLEKMRVTNGARKKIAQSIEKLHERPGILKNLELSLKNGSQCARCAICNVRQLLWSPFIKYDGIGNRKTSPEIIDGFNVPVTMISDENLPALLFRVIETLNSMVFPLKKDLFDLEDEYQLTMFHMFESVMKNEAFTPAQQRRAFHMKKNARQYANPEEIRRHRMGMVSSAQCEGCHHAEVVNRERLMELQDRQIRQCRGDFTAIPAMSVLLDQYNADARLEFNVPAATPAQRIQKRPAVSEDDEWVGSPKITAAAASPTDSIIFESLILPQIQSTNFWENVENIWGDDGNQPSTSFRFPLYRKPDEMEVEQEKEEDDGTEDQFTLLQMVPSDDQETKEASLSDFNFPESVSSSKKANSTGSGYSSSDSESSMVITSPCTTTYGVNQILCSPSYEFL